jgi:hypothetical protein
MNIRELYVHISARLPMRVINSAFSERLDGTMCAVAIDGSTVNVRNVRIQSALPGVYDSRVRIRSFGTFGHLYEPTTAQQQVMHLNSSLLKYALD